MPASLPCFARLLQQPTSDILCQLQTSTGFKQNILSHPLVAEVSPSRPGSEGSSDACAQSAHKIMGIDYLRRNTWDNDAEAAWSSTKISSRHSCLRDQDKTAQGNVSQSKSRGLRCIISSTPVCHPSIQPEIQWRNTIHQVPIPIVSFSANKLHK